MASGNVKVTTDTSFDKDVLQNSGLVMVDFWAEWCGPCRALAPKIEEVSTEFSTKVSTFKINIDENPETAPKFHIRGIPTVIFFKNGQMVDQVVGNQGKDAYINVIERHS